MVVIKDEIHRTIELNDFEKEVMDTDDFQRLRRIKQLAMTYLVYPSATHTRFEHSIGSVFLASQICKKLNLEKELEEKIRLYSLLHDIGHSAFSHESEKILSHLLGNHEEIGRSKILEGEISDIIGMQYDPKEIIEIADSLYGRIISSDVGSDRMDYLLRDSHNTGVAYGIIDTDRIIHKMFLDKENEFLGVEIGGLEAVESLLIGRFMMFSTVYFHSTVRVASTMLRTSIIDALENDFISAEDFLNASDEQIFLKLLSFENSYAKELADRLLNRKLYKVAYSISPNPKIEQNLETIMSEIKEETDEDFLFDIPRSSSHQYEINIKTREGELKEISSLSAPVNALKEAEESRRKLLLMCSKENKEKLKQIGDSIFSLYLDE